MWSSFWNAAVLVVWGGRLGCCLVERGLGGPRVVRWGGRDGGGCAASFRLCGGCFCVVEGGGRWVGGKAGVSAAAWEGGQTTPTKILSLSLMSRAFGGLAVVRTVRAGPGAVVGGMVGGVG